MSEQHSTKQRYQRQYRARIVTRTCGKCGASYQCRNGESRFCPPCGLAVRLQNIQKPASILRCQQCGQDFKPAKLSRKFCSRQCKTLASRGRKKKSVTDPKARAAHTAVRAAVRDGRLTRPSGCEQCGQVRKIEAAHHDYDKPLEVRWLCVPCHRRWDKANPKGGAHSVILRRAESEGLAVERAEG